MTYQHTDGGRAAAGFVGKTGDCAARAMALALKIPYAQAYKVIADANAAAGKRRSVRHGVMRDVFGRVLSQHGWVWHPAPKFPGRKARCSDMPLGIVIARQAGHFVCVIDGVPHDIFDCTTKMIYGYWVKA